MNFYDTIHSSMKALKESEEYKKYTSIKKALKEDEKSYQKIKEFKEKQREQHMQYISGKEISKEVNEELQNMYVELIKNEKVASFFESEIRLDVMLADMQKIINETIQDIIEL